MGLRTQLIEGKKLRFNSLDIDIWSYDEQTSTLLQWINDQQTEERLTVLELDDYIITVDWGQATSTFFEVDIELV